MCEVPIYIRKLDELTSKNLPKNEEFGISSKIRRAVVSVPSNIAEGFGRKNLKEYIQFLYIALASCFETETQLIIIDKVFQIKDPEAENLLNEIIKMLYSLIAKLKIKIV